MSAEIIVRGIEPDAAADVARLSGELGYPADEREIARRLATLERAPDDLLLGAYEPDGTIVGWIHAFIARRLESGAFAEIGGMVVAESHRGRGIGSRLIDEVETWAWARGAARLRVRSRDGRHDAHAFYERRGFERSKLQVVLDKTL